MATQINGKLYRNVKGASEGIVTSDLKIVNSLGETVTRFDQGNEALQVNTIEDIAGDNSIQLLAADEGIKITSPVSIELNASNGDAIIKLSPDGVQTNYIEAIPGSEGLSIYSAVEDGQISIENSSGSVSLSGENIILNAGNAIVGESSLYFADSAEENCTLTIGEESIALQGLVIMSELPTSDPEVAGALWNDNGVLKISAGE